MFWCSTATASRKQWTLWTRTSARSGCPTWCGNLRNRPAAEIVEAVHKAVFDFAQGAPQFDDITVVVARKL